MYLFLAAPCLCHCLWAFCRVESGGYSPVALQGLLIATPSVAVGAGSRVCWLQEFQHTNLCPLHWQGHSLPLDYSFEQCI